MTLCAVTQLVGAWWSADNTIVYGGLPGDLMRISGNGGTPQSFLKTKVALAQCPQILPDGKSVLFESHVGGHKVVVQSLGSGEPKELFAGSGAHYVSTGHIIYTSENSLFAVPFDPDKLEMSGGQVPLVEGIYQTDLPQFAVSDSGTLVYIPAKTGAAPAARTLVWVDRNGKEEPLAAAPNDYYSPKVSPDGTRVALTVGESPKQDIWTWIRCARNYCRLNMCPALGR